MGKKEDSAPFFALQQGAVPPRLVAKQGEYDGWTRSWMEYLPAGWEGRGEMPLVVSLHGGDFHRGHLTTSWHVLAEREGFIVLYPHSIREGTTWNSFGKLGPQHGMPDDPAFLDALIEDTCRRYPIDAGRVYLHGQSMGDMIGTDYLFRYGQRIAAAALFSGPAKTKFILSPQGQPQAVPGVPVPVLRLHGELDNYPVQALPPREQMRAKRVCHIDVNNALWKKINQAEDVPIITAWGCRVFESYRGRSGADLVFYSLAGGGHRPPLDVMGDAWSFFCAWQRVEGRPRHTGKPPYWEAAPQENCAVCEEAPLALVNNRTVSLDAPPALNEDGVLLVEAGLFSVSHPGLRAQAEEDALRFDWQGHRALFAPGRPAMLLDGRLVDLPAPEYRQGRHFLPFCEVEEKLFGRAAQSAYGCAYACGRPFSLTYDATYTLKAVLRGKAGEAPDFAAIWKWEDELFRLQCAELGKEIPPAADAKALFDLWTHT